MSSALDLLQSSNNPLKPYKGFSQLEHGDHRIFSFRLVNNRHYKEVDGTGFNLKRVLLVELADQVLFLPEYFAAPFLDDEQKVAELNKDKKIKYLCFRGSRPNR